MDQIELTDPSRRRFRVEVPTTRQERVRGLRGRDGLAPEHAMLFPRCRSVHTFGMAFPVDMVLLDEEHHVVTVVGMPPGRLLLPRRGVRHILECPAGVDLRPGDRLVTGARS
jgi:uncharacterized membrane protein (UPF0127 family)